MLTELIEDRIILQTQEMSGEQPELQYRFIDAAGDNWLLAKIKGLQEKSVLGGELVIETKSLTKVPDDITEERLRIDANGNIGIGTATPTAALEVSGEVKADLFTERGTGLPLVSSQWTDSGGGTINYSGGNVGIGVSGGPPKKKLEVNGEIKATNFIKGTQPLVSSQWVSVANDISYSAGNVGIGASNPAANLHIGKAEDAAGTLGAINRLAIQPYGHTGGLWVVTARDDSSNAYLDLKYGSNNLLTVVHNGNVGIGTTNPTLKLDVRGYNRLTDPGEQYNSHFPAENNNAYVTGDNIYLRGGAPQGWRETVTIHNATGDVSISGRLGTMGWSPVPRTPGWGGGIHTWDIEAEGTIWARQGSQSGNRDLAENYHSTMNLEPGDVVCVDRAQDGVVLSTAPNDLSVMGLVSTAPGFLLNEMHDPEGEKVYPIALCGRVPCKVVAENGPIARGDLLTTSSTPGHAMKALPIVVADQNFYRPGTILGKALGTLAAGEGVIEIFVSIS